MKNDNVHDLPNAEKAKAELARLERIAPEAIEVQKIMAHIRFAAYKAHVQAGFTNEQAMSFCVGLYK